MKPEIAERLMQIFGTEKAEKMFPAEKFMRKSEDGKATFKWAEYVSRYEIKSYFGRRQQDKKNEKASKK